MAFTPYVAIAALLLAGVATVLRNWSAAAVTGIAMLCLAAVVFAAHDRQLDRAGGGHETLEVLSANIHHGTADPDVLIALVDRYEPDLLSQRRRPLLTPATHPASALASDLFEAHPGAVGAQRGL